MCDPEDPLFTSPVVCKGPISSKSVSSQDPLLRKFGNYSLYSLNFCPKFSSHAPKIWEFSVHKPPNLEIFSSQAPLSEENTSSQALHFGYPGRTPHTWKKVECPHLRYRAGKGNITLLCFLCHASTTFPFSCPGRLHGSKFDGNCNVLLFPGSFHYHFNHALCATSMVTIQCFIIL